MMHRRQTGLVISGAVVWPICVPAATGEDSVAPWEGRQVSAVRDDGETSTIGNRDAYRTLTGNNRHSCPCLRTASW